MRVLVLLALALLLAAGCGDSSPAAPDGAAADGAPADGAPADGPACPRGTRGCPCLADSTCPDLVCAGGACRDAIPCADACAAHQACVAATTTVDGICLPACDAGYAWDEGAVACVAVPAANCTPGAADSIAAACAGQARECVTDAAGAHCDGCVSGFLDDGGTCRQPYSCATVAAGCGPRQRCVEDPTGGDATCVDQSCPPCSGAGEVGVYPTLSQIGACVCETAPGYFYTLSGDVGTFPCDADGDGWVRESARFALESQDPALRANARCALRTVDRIVLHNEAGQTHTVTLAAPLPLYESVRNDDQALLDLFGVPPRYGAGRALAARELNGLTKACVSSVADHNDNKVPDVVEWGRLPSSQSSITTAAGVAADMLERVKVYTRFSYFVELARGWYEAPTGGDQHGRYHVAERPRVAAAGAVPLVYGPEPSGAWTSDFVKTCPRSRDTWYSTQYPPIGMDFAAAPASAAFTGLGHSSQFKCVHLYSQADYDALTAEQRREHRERQTMATVATLNWQLNACRAEAGATTPPAPNPAEPELACAAVADPLPAGTADVLWAAVRLDTSPSYQRGCLLTCPGTPFICAGHDPSQPAPDCYHVCADVAGSELRLERDGGIVVRAEVPITAVGDELLSDVNDAGVGLTVRALTLDNL